MKQTKALGRLPVVNFAAGGVATPADAAMMMQMGCDGVFVGSGIFKSADPAKRARAIVQAVTHYNDPKILAEVSMDLGEPMVGLECKGPTFVACASLRGVFGSETALTLPPNRRLRADATRHEGS